MERNIEAIRGDLDMLVEVIPKTVPTVKIILFGSFVNGTPHKDSDIDIYVVLGDGAAGVLDSIDEMRHALGRRIKMPMDLLACHKTRFDQRKVLPTLERVVTREGMVLYGN